MRDFLSGDYNRVRLNGPDLTLNSRAALSFALLIHELATNALKHGALSVPAGVVEVSWRIEIRPGEGPADLIVDWKELNGPPVKPQLAEASAID